MIEVDGQSMYSVASDNYAGALPEIVEAVVAANAGHQQSYGRDIYTARLEEVVRSLFGGSAECFPVFNGTGGNVVALQSMQPAWGGVICTSVAHINTDECGAPEHVAGLKLLPVESARGKLTRSLIDEKAVNFGNVHHAQPTVVSVTESTELGTVYSVEELGSICDYAHSLGMRVHMDGARLANAAATLGVSLGNLTTDVGVDVLSLGGTKCGLLFGELVVVLNPSACDGMAYVRKFNMQLASKMRFVSAQLVTLLEDDLWLKAAARANAAAALLRERVDHIPEVVVTQPTEANAVFAVLPIGAEEQLRKSALFQTWNPLTSEVRWMCSHDTEDDEVLGFARALEEAVQMGAKGVRSEDRDGGRPATTHEAPAPPG